MSRLGDTIRGARLKKAMTPKALAKKCGVSESFIVEVESGRRIVSDDQAQRILKVLGVDNPVSTELEVASEPEVKLRPAPRPYVLPVDRPEKKPASEEPAAAPTDAWLDALGGVVKRVPIMGMDGVVVDHRLLPVIGGKIEGGNPEKVLYYRCPDDSMRGFRIHPGDLLLEYKGKRLVRKVRKQEGGKLMLQHYDREFVGEVVSVRDVLIIGRCVRLEATL